MNQNERLYDILLRARANVKKEHDGDPIPVGQTRARVYFNLAEQLQKEGASNKLVNELYEAGCTELQLDQESAVARGFISFNLHSQ